MLSAQDELEPIAEGLIMKIYKAKTLFDGYKIGLQNPDKYIGVPAGKGYTHAAIDNKLISVKDRVPATSRDFTDKFGRGNYTLEYFPVIAESTQETLIATEQPVSTQAALANMPEKYRIEIRQKLGLPNER